MCPKMLRRVSVVQFCKRDTTACLCFVSANSCFQTSGSDKRSVKRLLISGSRSVLNLITLIKFSTDREPEIKRRLTDLLSEPDVWKQLLADTKHKQAVVSLLQNCTTETRRSILGHMLF